MITKNDLKIEKQKLTDSDELLIKRSIQGISWRYPKQFPEDHVKRLEYELNVIMTMGFSDYFLIVQDFLDLGRRIGYMPDSRIEYLKKHVYEMSIKEMFDYINADQSYPGLTVGPGRGSAAGSLVTFLLGITNIDPIENGLLFERFLNTERVSMPDIDSDYAKSEYEYGVRDIVIEYAVKKYGKNAICGITTPSTEAPRGAIDDIARIAGSKKVYESEENLDKEKVKKEFLQLADRIKKYIPTDDQKNIHFSSPMDPEDKNSPTVADVLHQQFANEPEALNIIDLAIKLEGVNTNYGMHACGKIVYPGDIRKDYAMMKDIKTGIWKLQMDAEKAEEAGLLKIDFLGLKNLNVITKTARLVYQNYGIKLDLNNIPQSQEVYDYIFATAKTLSIFQFESAGMRGMLKRFGPGKFSDLVLLVACYRPGPLKYLGDIIKRKHGKATDNNTAIMKIKEIHSIVENTYYAIVYQEQVQQIFRTLAGYSLGQADLVRRAMGHKKIDVLEKEKNAFLYGDAERNIIGCQANGIDMEAAAQLFEEMKDFAKYAFNKSHAAAYALVSYITAYLKYYYPTEFYTATLEFADISKYPALIAEAKSLGVTVHGPDIEKSQDKFYGKNKEIYFGFGGIKGIGGIGNMPNNVVSIADFILASNIAEGTMETLVSVGAFDRKVKNRKALLAVLPDYYKEKKKINDGKAKMANVDEMLTDLHNGVALDRKKYKITTKSLPTITKLEERKETIQESINTATQNIRQMIIPSEVVVDDIDANLEKEKALIGMYASGNPLDPYGTPADHGCTPLADLDVNRYKDLAHVYGKISDLKMRTQRKDGRSMCTFVLTDQTDSIECCCFADSYELCGKELQNDAIVKLEGQKKAKQGDEEESFQFILGKSVSAAIRVYDKKDSYYITANGIEEWTSLQSLVMPFVQISGHPLFVYDSDTGAMYKTGMRVSEDVQKVASITIAS